MRGDGLVTVGDETSRVLAQPMMSRRAVIMAGAASAFAVAGPFAKSALSAVSPQASVLGAVFDRDFPQSRFFAERASSLGIKSFGFARDMSSLWFSELLPMLRANPRPIVGLTSGRALFCFEQFAWDVGMRVRLRIDHLENRDGFRHFPSAGLASSALNVLAADGAFGRRALDLVLGCPQAWGNCTHATSPESSSFRGEPLVTWVIAPLRGP